MDNNLINIDDLFRQRLGGGEEQERAGSWMRMKELLDTEERRRPAGFFWRRSLAYIGILLLLAGMTFGGYELNVFRNLGNGTGTQDRIAGNTGNPDKHSDNSILNGAVASTSGSAVIHRSGPVAAMDNHESTTDNTTASSSKSGTSLTANHTTGSGTVNSTNENANTYSTNPNETRSTTGKHEIINSTLTAAGSNIAVTGTNDRKQNNTTASVATDDKKLAATAPVKTKTARTGTNKKGNATEGSKENSDGLVVNNKNSSAVHEPSAISRIGKGASDATAFADGATSDPRREHDKMSKVAPGKIARNATTVSAPAAGTLTTTTNPVTAASKTTSTPLTATAQVSNKPTGKNKTTPTHSFASAGTDHKKATKSIMQVRGTDNTLASITGRSAKHNKATPITGNTVNKAGTAAKPNATAPVKELAVVAPRQQKMVQKIVIVQRRVGTIGSQQIVLDTISVDNVMEDIIASAEKTSGQPSVLRSLYPNAVPPAAPAASKSNSNAVASLAASNNSTIDNLQSSAANKKSGSGLSTIQHLNAAFNDVKYKIQGVQFAPGLTAGINGTFFGPNSFRGFQFGLTGTFIVDEDWSLMAEVKYFNRMNNNYAMVDNYVDYNKKDSVANTFSFSTLHSFELPISIRYSAGKCSFFAGGNFAYALGINTGPDPVRTSLVNAPAPGQKSAPSLTSEDFASRFGIGYLFGMSFEVSPNVALDFRSTQNLWDNMHSSGGKAVSDQLYKSPSLQFSINYRFSGKPKK